MKTPKQKKALVWFFLFSTFLYRGYDIDRAAQATSLVPPALVAYSELFCEHLKKA